MDVNITHAFQRTLQPRLFWRRVFAYLIDMTFLEFLLASVALIIPLNFGIPLFESTQCGEAASGPLVEKVEREWPLKLGETRVNQICRSTQYWGQESTFFQTTVITGNSGGQSVSWRVLSVALDENGELAHGTADLIGPLVGVFLVLLAFAFLTANGRRTPSKWISSIRVVTTEGASPHLSEALKRELLKFSPWIAFVASDSIVAAIASNQSLDDMIRAARDGTAAAITPILIGASLFIPALLWWLLPLIRWRGQMFYDRFAGCEVRSTRSNSG
ncbi:RDD family protein [Rhizobium mulingense]|uniref:RDD family protein n=1 Tax=Rhizobium mulingense TaxID=3031128 RepID=UPI002B47D2C1|nr:RDD family protein [Rhizobium sp. MJ21]MEB3046649.1 RDD family protein [Rhizobium sp. MJ21]